MIRRITEAAVVREVEALYADVFGAALNRRLVIGLISNGGYLFGAYEARRLVGYGLSFPAVEGERPYHYSQTVGVASGVQGRGIGRALKQAQREAAIADGSDLLRWVFDPMSTRNAHFNTDVLGARITRFHRDFYGEGTDRVRVDWPLTDAPAPIEWTVPDLAPGQSKEVERGLAVAAPVDRDALADVFDRGLVGVSCRRADEHTAVYLFIRP